ncbi:MAG: hypothetical protein WA397_15035 [Roseiarcus sp.]
MTSITKYACAFVLAGGLASPGLAAQGDAGSGPTTGATSTNDAGSGPTKGTAVNSQSPTQHGQTEMNANSAAVNPGSPIQKGQTATNENPAATGARNMHIAQKLRADLVKAGYTDISIRPSSFFIQAKNSEGNPVTMMISPDSVTALTEATRRVNSASNSQHMGGSSNSAGATPGPSSTGGSQPVSPGGSSNP